MSTARTSSNRTAVVMALLFGLIVVCYGHTLHAPWYFDDLLRIVNNPAIQLNHLSITDITDSIHYGGSESAPRGGLHRPVAMISFALNWFFFKDNVAGYRAVNLLIHFLSALVLYKTICRLLQSGNGCFGDEGKSQFVALTAAILWAMHPIQSQAVTYIVQRSTSLAAFFFIAGIWFYVSGRKSVIRRQAIAAFVGCGVCYLLALATKLNTILLPASLLLIEVLFFQDLSSRKDLHRIAVLGMGIGALLAIGCIGFLWAWKGNPNDYFQGAYQDRPFSMYQRLLTEARILWFYLSQLAWPLPGRFSLVHEFALSTSLLHPWTTLPSLIGIAAAIGLGLAFIIRRPFICLAILFFFLNHLIESTVIPLELVFEHRNYLPGMFLFVPVAIGLQKGIYALSTRGRFLHATMMAGTIFLLIALGWATHSRNSMWNDKKRFWEDALVKAPHTARPYLQLAAYHETHGNRPLALKLYHHSLNLYDPAPKRVRALAHTNMGVLLNKMQQKEIAIEHFRSALAIFPEHEIARYNLVFALLSRGDYHRAKDHAEVLLANNPSHPYYLNAAGLIALQLRNLALAEGYLAKALTQAPRDVNILINLGVFRGRLGQNDLATSLLEKAMRLAPHDPTPRLCLIDLALKGDQTTLAEGLARDLIAQIPLGITMNRIEVAKTGIKLFEAGRVYPIILTFLDHVRMGGRV